MATWNIVYGGKLECSLCYSADWIVYLSEHNFIYCKIHTMLFLKSFYYALCLLHYLDLGSDFNYWCNWMLGQGFYFWFSIQYRGLYLSLPSSQLILIFLRMHSFCHSPIHFCE